MKHIAILIFGFAFLLSPLQAQDLPEEPPPPAEEEMWSETERALHQFLDKYGRMWETEDLDVFDEVIAQDADLVVIGTDTAEYFIGFKPFREAREAQYEAFDNLEHYVVNRDLRISESGEVAWFAERFNLFTIDGAGESIMLEDLRLTGVIEKRDDGWKIVHLHTSLPVAGQAAQY